MKLLLNEVHVIMDIIRAGLAILILWVFIMYVVY